MGRYCGEELSGRDINVGGNEVVIKFHSDFYLGKKGFLLVFTPVQPCKFKRNFLNVTKHRVAKGVWKENDQSGRQRVKDILHLKLVTIQVRIRAVLQPWISIYFLTFAPCHHFFWTEKSKAPPTPHSKLFLSKTQRVEFSCYPKEHSIRRRWKTGIHLATVSKFSMMTGKSRYFCDSCDVSQLVLCVCLIKHS